MPFASEVSRMSVAPGRPGTDPEEGCVVCAMRPFLSAGYLMGFIPVIFTCPHRNLGQGIYAAKFCYGAITHFSWFLCIVCGGIYEALDIWPIDYSHSAMFLLLKLRKVLESLAGAVTLISHFMWSSCYMHRMNAMEALVQRARSLRMHLFSKRQERYIYRLNIVFFFSSSLYTAIIVWIIAGSWHDADFLYVLATELIRLYSIYALYFGISFISLTMDMYGKMFESVHLATQTVLDQIQVAARSRRVTMIVRESATSQIRQLRRLAMAVHIELTYFLESHDPSAVLFGVNIFVYAVGMTYVVIVTLWDQLDYRYGVITLLKESVTVWFLVSYMVYRGNFLQLPNKRMQEYLLSYTLTILPPEIAYEVEFYLMSLEDLCPYYTPSSILD